MGWAGCGGLDCGIGKGMHGKDGAMGLDLGGWE